jgi:phosphatidylserine synthase
MSITCKTNINGDYDNILFQMNLLNKDSQTLTSDRKKLYLTACIPIRITLALIAGFLFFYIKNEKMHKYLSIFYIFIGLFSFIHLITKSQKDKNCQWWSNNFQKIIALLIFIFAIIFYFINPKLSSLSTTILIVISVIGGLSQLHNLK